MKKTWIIIGGGLLTLSAFLFYAERNQAALREDSASEAVEQVLRAQNTSLQPKVEYALTKADRDASNIYLRTKKKARGRSFLSDPSLAEPEAPKWIIVGDKKVRSADVSQDSLLEEALADHLEKGPKLALHSANGKYFLFIKGEAEGENFVSAYDPAAFFSVFRSSDGIRVWLVQKDGTILFHPLPRFIGTNAANLRPVAAGIQALESGATTIFTQKYLGLEGKEAMGAWSGISEFDLLIGSEWPKPMKAESKTFLWYALFTGLCGAFFFGLAFSAQREVSAAEPEEFNPVNLDDKAMEYLSSLKSSTDQAIHLAQEQETMAREATAERGEAMNRLRFLEWKLKFLEEYMDKILAADTGKQVWSSLAELYAERFPIAVTMYRYSQSTFSLVPESVSSALQLPDHAMAYLADARIFIGNPNLIQNTLGSEAFSRWNKVRNRHMPLHQTEFRIFPISSAGALRGMLLVMFDQRMNLEGELEESFELFNTLVQRTSSFCDTQGPLLQFPYAKGSSGASLASAPNNPRG